MKDAPREPLDMPLPCDVKVGHTTFRKGVALRSLVMHANRLRDELHQSWADALTTATSGTGRKDEPKCPRCGLPQSECDFQKNFPDPEPFF